MILIITLQMVHKPQTIYGLSFALVLTSENFVKSYTICLFLSSFVAIPVSRIYFTSRYLLVADRSRRYRYSSNMYILFIYYHILCCRPYSFDLIIEHQT